MKTIYNWTKCLSFLIITLSFSQSIQAQNFPGCPEVDGGPDQSICPGECVDFTATLVGGAETSSYVYDSIPYTPFPYNVGTPILIGTDDIWSDVIALPFDFCFYEDTYNQFVISSNGVVSFNAAFANGFSNWAIANGIPGNMDVLNSIMSPFHDIDPGVGGQIYYDIIGTAPCRAAVISWDQVPMFGCNYDLATQQIVIYETTNVIDIYVANKPLCTAWDNGAAIMGIQDATATQALVINNYNFPTQWTNMNEAWRISPDGVSTTAVSWYDDMGIEIATGLTVTVCPGAPTEYTVAANYSGCNASVDVVDTVAVSYGGIAALSIAGDTLLCNGASTILTATAGYTTYNWTTPIGTATGQTITATQSGLYAVSVSDGAGCSGSASINITILPSLSLDATVVNAGCVGQNTGSVSVDAPAGAPPLTYIWNNGSTASSISALAPGSYSVTVTDANGCTGQGTYIVGGSTTNIEISTIGSVNTSCGEDNGIVYVSAIGGVQNYMYSLDNCVTFQSSNTFLDLSPGTYDVCVEDATGCQTSGQVSVGTSTDVQIDFAALDDPSSCGSYDGSIEIFASGGAAPYMYSNNNGMVYGASSVFTGLGANTYNLVVMDAGGCYDTLIVDLIDPTAPVIDSIYAVNPMCGEEDGFIEILLESGTGNPNFEYSIDNGTTFQGSNTFNDLPDGVYEIIVEDFLGCRATAQISLFQAGGPVVSNFDISNATCGDDNAVITAYAADGTTPYEYSIDGINYQTGATFTNLAPGQYTVIIRDAAGCEVEDIAIITTDGSVISSISTTSPTACNIADGTLLINANGGTPPYEFSINNGVSYQNSGLFSGLSPNTFNVVVQDANGCLSIQIVDIIGLNDPIITAIDISNAACGEDDGAIDISMNGGTPNYEFSIDGGLTFQGDSLFSDVAAGVYEVVVVDFLGCETTGQAIVNGATAPEINTVASEHPTCGNIDGSIIITAGNGTPGLSYSIDGGVSFQSNSVFNGLGAGIYDIIVQDAAGCESFEQVVLMDAGGLNIDNIDVDDSICDEDNGAISIIVSGGTLPYQFSLDNGQNYQSGNVFSGLLPNTYNILIEDANGCQTAQVFTMTSVGVPVLDSILITPSTCNKLDGALDIFASGGAPVYQYSIDGGTTFQAVSFFDELPSGTYDVIVEDANGCQATEQVDIFPTTAATPLILADGPTSFCFYESVNLYAGDFASYMWSTGDTVSTINANTGGTYFVTVTDDQGCTGIAQQVLDVVAPFSVLAGDDQIVEVGDTYDVGVEFPDAALTYTWTGSDGSTYTGDSFSEDATQVGTITYTVTATLNGCVVTDEVVVTIIDSSLWAIPNVFSPNADGLNDDFGPVVNGSTQVTTFKVFNRWGEVVHDDVAARWDGTFRGKKQVGDAYTYLIILTTFENKDIELTGSVTLMN